MQEGASLDSSLRLLFKFPPSHLTPPPQVHASLIVVLTRGGSTARLVAKYRPVVPVLTVAVPVLTTGKWGKGGSIMGEFEVGRKWSE